MTRDIAGASAPNSGGVVDNRTREYLPSHPSDAFMNTRDIPGAQSRFERNMTLISLHSFLLLLLLLLSISLCS